MKKRIISLFLVLVMSLSLCVFASAEDSVEYEERMQQLENIANLDVDEATPEMKEKILEARREIIYSTDWVADGYTAYIQDMETGEIIRDVPNFSDVFPGWDIPFEEVTPMDPMEEDSIRDIPEAIPENNTAEIIPLIDIGVGLNDWLRVVSGRVYLNEASSENADPYAVVTVDPYDVGTVIRAGASELSSSETCNVGISDYFTGESYGYATRLPEGQTYAVDIGIDGPTVAVRASTYGTPGWATMIVDGAYRIRDLK